MSHYTMLLQWSDADQVSIVSLPEWEEHAGLIGHTHGATYSEAVRMGEELLAMLIEGKMADGLPLPAPRIFATSHAGKHDYRPHNGTRETTIMNNPVPHYSMVLEWSDEDQTFVVILPEWTASYAMPVADGKTYAEALKRGQNALEHLIAIALADGTPLPAPCVFAQVHS